MFSDDKTVISILKNQGQSGVSKAAIYSLFTFLQARHQAIRNFLHLSTEQ